MGITQFKQQSIVVYNTHEPPHQPSIQTRGIPRSLKTNHQNSQIHRHQNQQHPKCSPLYHDQLLPATTSRAWDGQSLAHSQLSAVSISCQSSQERVARSTPPKDDFRPRSNNRRLGAWLEQDIDFNMMECLFESC